MPAPRHTQHDRLILNRPCDQQRPPVMHPHLRPARTHAVHLRSHRKPVAKQFRKSQVKTNQRRKNPSLPINFHLHRSRPITRNDRSRFRGEQPRLRVPPHDFARRVRDHSNICAPFRSSFRQSSLNPAAMPFRSLRNPRPRFPSPIRRHRRVHRKARVEHFRQGHKVTRSRGRPRHQFTRPCKVHRPGFPDRVELNEVGSHHVHSA